MKRIVLVQHKKVLADALLELIEQVGDFDLHLCQNLEEALLFLSGNRVDLLIMDRASSGPDVSERLFRSFADLPVIFLTSQEEASEALASRQHLRLIKPFSYGDLHSGIYKILAGQQGAKLRLGDWTLDVEHRSMHQNHGEEKSTQCKLTERETQILAYLYHKPFHMAERSEILQEVWGYHPDVNTDTLDTHIYRLRRKINQAGGESNLIIRAGSSYRLDMPDRRKDAS